MKPLPVCPERILVHGWDRIRNFNNRYSLLALSTHKNVKCYPTMTKNRAKTQPGVLGPKPEALSPNPHLYPQTLQNSRL